MKNLSLLLLLSYLLICSIACDSELEVNGDWEEVTIIYGLLDVTDSVQYIRINKAFLGDENALELAQVGDSLFHETAVTAVIKEYVPNEDGVSEADLVETYLLERVLASEEGIVKDTGTFASEPHYLYKLDAPLNQNHVYHLEVTTPRQNFITSSTPIVEAFELAINVTEPFAITPDFTYNLVWQRADNATIYEGDIYFNIDVFRPNTTEKIGEERIKWNLFSNYKGTDVFQRSLLSYEIEYERLISFLSTALSANDTIHRQIVSMDIHIFAGSEELEKFRQVALAQFSFTSSFLVTTYSNIEGNNTLGLFSSRSDVTLRNYTINNFTMRRIACEPILSDFNLISPLTGRICD